MTDIYLKLGEVGEICLKENTSLGRGEDIDRLLLPPLLAHPIQTLIREVKDLSGLYDLIRGKKDNRCRLFLPSLQINR